MVVGVVEDLLQVKMEQVRLLEELKALVEQIMVQYIQVEMRIKIILPVAALDIMVAVEVVKIKPGVAVHV